MATVKTSFSFKPSDIKRIWNPHKGEGPSNNQPVNEGLAVAMGLAQRLGSWDRPFTGGEFDAQSIRAFGQTYLDDLVRKNYLQPIEYESGLSDRHWYVLTEYAINLCYVHALMLE